MVDWKKIQNYYSRPDVQKAIVEIAKNREVVSVFKDGRFGKRPDVIQYPADIVQAVTEGAVAFHGSVERWNQPMKLDVGLTKPELDRLRKAWDIFIDVDVADFDVAKTAVKQIIEALKDHGLSSYSCKFTGGKSFHIGIPYEALPEQINLQSTATLYPDMLQKIIGYIKWYTTEQLREELLALSTPIELAKSVGKSINEIVGSEGIEPFKVVSMDVFGSRHLFRLPYSLHESSLLVSLPIKPKDVEKFKKEDAAPEKVKVKEKFLVPVTALQDAEALVVDALDWAARYKAEVRKLPKPRRAMKIRKISKRHFPPCIAAGILKGLADGRKRSVFILINFLRNMGWNTQEVEKALTEWNERNYPPLRRNYLRTQLRWHLRQERNLLPPNCDNPIFYTNMNVCQPDAICKGNTDSITIKNPMNYSFRRLKRLQRKLKRRK